MAKRLVIDLDACARCSRVRECAVQCSYVFHPGNNGITAVREAASFAVVCRRCQTGTCVDACPKEALVRGEDGIVRRRSMRCIRCGSCVLACPFGTIFLEVIPYALSRCDLCEGRLGEGETPVCVATCPEGALAWEEVGGSEEAGLQLVGDGIAVRAVSWRVAEGLEEGGR